MNERCCSTSAKSLLQRLHSIVRRSAEEDALYHSSNRLPPQLHVGTRKKTKSKPAESSSQSNAFECPICLEVLLYPVTTLCGHSFCFHCVFGSIKHCPLCRRDLEEKDVLTVDSNLQTRIRIYVHPRILAQREADALRRGLRTPRSASDAKFHPQPSHEEENIPEAQQMYFRGGMMHRRAPSLLLPKDVIRQEEKAAATEALRASTALVLFRGSVSAAARASSEIVPLTRQSLAEEGEEICWDSPIRPLQICARLPEGRRKGGALVAITGRRAVAPSLLIDHIFTVDEVSPSPRQGEGADSPRGGGHTADDFFESQRRVLKERSLFFSAAASKSAGRRKAGALVPGVAAQRITATTTAGKAAILASGGSDPPRSRRRLGSINSNAFLPD